MSSEQDPTPVRGLGETLTLGITQNLNDPPTMHGTLEKSISVGIKGDPPVISSLLDKHFFLFCLYSLCLDGPLGS